VGEEREKGGEKKKGNKLVLDVDFMPDTLDFPPFSFSYLSLCVCVCTLYRMLHLRGFLLLY